MTIYRIYLSLLYLPIPVDTRQKMWCLWFLLCVTVISKPLFTKIVHTPIYDQAQICTQHHIVLLQNFPFEDDQREYKDIYAIDFSPDIDITNGKTAAKILLGNKVPGKVRLVYFDSVDDDTLFREPLHKHADVPLHRLRQMDPVLYQKIEHWDTTFHLYMRNCQHFGRYLTR